MAFWQENVGQIITSNGFGLLTHTGTVSQERMEQATTERYMDFDRERRHREAAHADQMDEAELKALEAKLNGRSQP